MNITNNMTGTIRASEHGHQPIIFEPRSQDGVPRVGDQHISPTLNTGGVVSVNRASSNRTYTHNAYDTIIDSDTSSTLKANGENYGGGSESLVLQPSEHYRREITKASAINT